jgi:hypothetical protein
LPRNEATLPQAGPEPVFQMALKDSRFGFSAADRSSNLSLPPPGQHLQVIRFNPTHSNIDDNGNSFDTSDSSDGDGSSSDDNDASSTGSDVDVDVDVDVDSNEDNNNVDNEDNNEDNNNVDNGGDDIYGGNENEGTYMGKWLPKSLVMYELIV